MTKVELTDEEAKLFQQFREHQDDFQVLLEHGVFNFTQGMIVVHRDKDGNLRQLESKKILYRYTKKA